MVTLAFGLIVFFALHLIPMRPAWRAGLVTRLGRGAYLGLFSLVSVIGLILIVKGYGQMQSLGRTNPQLWSPPRWSRHITMLLMIPAFILLVAAYVPSRIRTAVKHPMLAAIKLWALAHLISNGDLASVMLFGTFLIWAIEDRISVKRRDALGPLGAKTGAAVNDIAVVAGGLLLYSLMLFWGHARLIGVPLLAP